MLILVPIAGEVKFHPFAGGFAYFQVSLGSPIFLLFLLWLHKFPRLLLGCAAGTAVIGFRIFLELYSGMAVAEAFSLHLSNFFYYFFYALFFALPRRSCHSIYEQARDIACWAVFAEVMASIGELTVMDMSLEKQVFPLTFSMLAKLLAIAVLRCFFILSFFFLFQLYTTEICLRRETQEKDRLSLLIAGLYEEAFVLKNTLQSAETVTHDCYDIYEKLSHDAADAQTRLLAGEILRIAGQCHEIKKNHQRIYASLSELANNRRVDDYLSPTRIADILVHVQQKYARSLGKKVSFRLSIEPALPSVHVFTLLSMLNNLAANAIEAIQHDGIVVLEIERQGKELQILFSNTGSSIAPDRVERVFQPGYTTKFDSNGKASSGVGLTYVKQQTESLGGKIVMESDGRDRVDCRLMLPLDRLLEGKQEEEIPCE
jgi:two-component system sensor histidine kinase YcbA